MIRKNLLLFICLFTAHIYQPVDAQNLNEPPRDPLLDSIVACDEKGDVLRSNHFARLWVEKKREQPGKDSLEYAKALVLLSDGLMAVEVHPDVLTLLKKALNLQEKAGTVAYGDAGRTCSKIGNFFFAQEDLAQTEIWWQKALHLREQAFGFEHESVATSLYNLGLLYEITQFQKSERMHSRALAIRKKVLPPGHEDIANSLQAMGNLYMNSFGDFVKAEPMFLEALELQEKNLGPDHMYVAYTLNSLGELFQAWGNYPKAEQYTLRSYHIICRKAGTQSAEAGILLNNLGAFYQETGDLKKALDYHHKALAIHEKGGENSTARASSLLNLGIINQKLGNFARSERQLTSAHRIKSQILGADHPSTAFVQGQLLALYRRSGQFQKAEKEGKAALVRMEKTWGLAHIETMNCRNELALLNWTQGKKDHAWKWFSENNRQNRLALKQVFPHLSDRGREIFLDKVSGNNQYFQSFCTAGGQKDTRQAGALFNHRLAFKGLLLSTSARWRKMVKNSNDSLLKKDFATWESLRNQIGNLFSSTDSSQLAGLTALLELAEKQERKLSAKLALDSQAMKAIPGNWQEVQKKLKPGEAAIEMVRIHKFGKHRSKDTTATKKAVYQIADLTDTIQYVAILLRKDARAPEMVILENGNFLEEKAIKLYQNAIRSQLQDHQSYDNFWQPIKKRLQGIRKVWFSADGIYHQINLNTLRNKATDKYLLEELDVHIISSCREIIENQHAISPAKTAFLIGNPTFGAEGSGSLARNESRSGTASLFLQPDPDLHLSALPGSQQEVDSVAGLLQRNGWMVQKRVGEAASEAEVKNVGAPQLLVFSTHGFFQADKLAGQNPMLYAGLLLAGSEKTLRFGRNEAEDDGILTAYEAMNLNLDNTDLVVLSACETGLGEVKNGEGVYGLQRAFKVAGAKTIIMSLWKVDDDATQELMVSFYKHWLGSASYGLALSERLNKRTAFLKAQKELKAKYPNPYFWGAFVMIGE